MERSLSAKECDSTYVRNVSSATDSTGGDMLPPNREDEATCDTSDSCEHNKRRGMRRRSSSCSEEIKINAFGRLYRKIINSAPAIRYLIYIVPIGVLIAIPIMVLGLNGYEDIHLGEEDDPVRGRIDGPHLFFFLIWIEAMWVALWLIKLFAWALPSIFELLAGVINSAVRKYVAVLHNLIKPLSFMLWTLTLWLTFLELIMDPVHHRDVSWVLVVQKIFAATFVSSAVLFIEKAFVQIVAVGYHQRSFANRIKVSKREVHLLSVLFNASRLLFPMYCLEFAKEDHIIKDNLEMKLREKSDRQGSRTSWAPPVQVLGHIRRFGSGIGSVVGKFTSDITGQKLFDNSSARTIVIDALRKRYSAEALARRIWLSLVEESRETLTLSDFKEVVVTASDSEVEEAFDMIDSDYNGDISLEEMVTKVDQIRDERKAINEGMRNIGQALKAFDSVLLVGVLALTIFIFVAWFRRSFIAVLATTGTAILSLSFAFAVSAQEFLGSCTFLFVKHPYDVGDRIEINNVPLLVERIALLYTVFNRVDAMKIVQIPNIQLNNLWIENLSRSKAMAENVSIDIAYETTLDDVELLREEMEAFVQSPANSREFAPEVSIEITGVGNLDKLILHVTAKHKSNCQNESVRAKRRTRFMAALALALKRVPIYPPGGGFQPLGGHLNPSYTVAVSDDFASQNRQKAEEMKETQRLVRAEESDEKQPDHQPDHPKSTLTKRHRMGDHLSGNTIRGDGDSITNSRLFSAVDFNEPHPEHGRRKAGVRPAPLSMSMSISPASVSPTTEYFDIEAQRGS